jgi:hypothetical protein
VRVICISSSWKVRAHAIHSTIYCVDVKPCNRGVGISSTGTLVPSMKSKLEFTNSKMDDTGVVAIEAEALDARSRLDYLMNPETDEVTVRSVLIELWEIDKKCRDQSERALHDIQDLPYLTCAILRERACDDAALATTVFSILNHFVSAVSNEYKTIFWTQEACENTLKVLKVHGKVNRFVALRGCDFVYNMCNKNETNRQEFCKLGAVKILETEVMMNESRSKAVNQIGKSCFIQ